MTSFKEVSLLVLPCFSACVMLSEGLVNVDGQNTVSLAGTEIGGKGSPPRSLLPWIYHWLVSCFKSWQQQVTWMFAENVCESCYMLIKMHMALPA